MHTTLKPKLLGLLGLGLLAGATLSPRVDAFFQLYPTSLQVRLPKDRPFAMTSLTIRNPGDSPLRLKVSAGHWDLGPNGSLEFLEAPTPQSVTEPVRLSPQEFELAPGERQVIRVGLAVRPEQPSGEYRTMVFLEDGKTTEERLQVTQGHGVQAQITFKRRLAVPAFVEKGTLASQPALEALACPVSDGQLLARMTLSNRGTRHARLKGSLLLLRPAPGRREPAVIRQVPVMEQVVLPGRTLALSQGLLGKEALASLPAGTYRAELHLTDIASTNALTVKGTSTVLWGG